MSILNVNFVKEGILDKGGLNYLGIEINTPQSINNKHKELTNKRNLFVFVIDNSGSMDMSAEKLKNIQPRAFGQTQLFGYSQHLNKDTSRLYYAKQSVKNFISALNEDDKIGIVTFSTDAKIVQSLVSAKEKEYIFPEIDRIMAESSTNMGKGLELAKEIISYSDLEKYNCKIILLSDGDINSGLREKELIELSQQYLEQGITISSLGLGIDYNSKLMNDIATGLFYHINELSLIDTILSEELKLTNDIVYSNVKLILKYKGLIEVSNNLNDIVEKNTADTKILTIGNLIGNTKKKIIFELKNDLEKELVDFEIILQLSKEEKIIINKSLPILKDKEKLDKMENNEDLLQYVIQVLKRNTLQSNTLNYMEKRDINLVNNNINHLEKRYGVILNSFNCSSSISNSINNNITETEQISQHYHSCDENNLKSLYCSSSSRSIDNNFYDN